MTHRARVSEDFAMEGVSVQLVEDTPSAKILRNFKGGSDYIARDESANVPESRDYRLFLRHDEARALYEELSRFYGGTASTLTDRADLLVERKRTDKLTDAVIAIATRGAA